MRRRAFITLPAARLLHGPLRRGLSSRKVQLLGFSAARRPAHTGIS